ncbi:hypothetical protein WEH80_25985 [Actinomycetes bacterium KLBMP 9759]
MLVEPAPRSFDELAVRSGGPESLSRALQAMTSDELSLPATRLAWRVGDGIRFPDLLDESLAG